MKNKDKVKDVDKELLSPSRIVKLFSGCSPNIIPHTEEEIKKEVDFLIKSLLEDKGIKNKMEEDFKHFVVFGKSKHFNTELLSEIFNPEK